MMKFELWSTKELKCKGAVYINFIEDLQEIAEEHQNRLAIDFKERIIHIDY